MSGLTTKTLTIGQCTYVLSHMPGLEALHLAARVGNALGPGFAGFLGGHGGVGQRSVTAFAWVLQSPDLGTHLESLTRALAPYTQVLYPPDSDGRQKSATLKDVIDAHFRGDIGGLFAWLEAAVEFELGDFLDSLRAKAKAALASVGADESSKSKSQSPAEPIG